jgi:hypothetical protein
MTSKIHSLRACCPCLLEVSMHTLAQPLSLMRMTHTARRETTCSTLWSSSPTSSPPGEQIQCRTDVNESGSAFLDLAITCRLICTTGRGKGDDSQPSCRGSTRTEHFLLHPTLYAIHDSTELLTDVGSSDHTPLRVIFIASTIDIKGLAGSGRMCYEECERRRQEEVMV